MRVPRIPKGRRPTAALLGFLVLLAVLPAGAGETDRFGFRPHPPVIQGNDRTGFRIGIPEGGSGRDAVLLFNKSNEMLEMRIYGASATKSPEGTISVGAFEARDRGAGEFVRPEKTQFSLGAREEIVIPFTVTRPQGRPAGLAAIVAEETLPPDESSSIDVVTRVAILIEVVDASGTPSVTMDRVEIDSPFALVPSRALVRVTATNTTASSVTSELEVTVRSLTGRRWELRPTSVSLDGGTTGTFEIEWTTVPRLGGLVVAEATLPWEGGAALGESGRNLIFPLWILLLIAAAAAGAWWGRSRSRRRSKTEDHDKETPSAPPAEAPPVADIADEPIVTKLEREGDRTRVIALLHKIEAACLRATTADTPTAARRQIKSASEDLEEAARITNGSFQDEALADVITSYRAAIEEVRASTKAWNEEADARARAKISAASKKLENLEEV